MARHPANTEQAERPPEPPGPAPGIGAVSDRPSAKPGRYVLSALLGLAVLGGLYLTRLQSYLLFHALAEGFSIIVGCGIFILAWNSRRFTLNSYLVFLGVAYLCVSSLDLVHTVAYKGMGVLAGASGNLAAQLWVCTRYVEGLSLLAAPFFVGRRLRADLIVLAYAAVFALILPSIFLWGGFPVCFVEGVGLTPFKKISEYVISLILLGSVGTLLWKRSSFDPAVLRLLIISILLTIASELAFTLYTDVYGLFNLIGHYFKIISFYFIYLAVLQIGLADPYALLFRDLKQSEQALKTESDFVSAVLSTAGALVVVLDAGGRIVRFNRACEDATGYRFDEVKGKHWSQVPVLPPGHLESAEAAFADVTGERRSSEYEGDLLAKDGSRRHVAWRNAALAGSDDQVSFVVATGIDVTWRDRAERRLRQALAEKEVLLAETHHRVRNNLQIIGSLLELSCQRTDSQEAAAVLREAGGRVFTMGLIHSDLYRAERLDRIDMRRHVHRLADRLADVYAGEGRDIRLLVATSGLRLTLAQAVPCGLIINELITNAYQHAFPGRQEGTIVVTLEDLPDQMVAVRVKDDGVGMPDDVAIEQPDTLGLQLVKGLSDQVGGTVSLLRGRGTEVVIRFKLVPPKASAGPPA